MHLMAEHLVEMQILMNRLGSVDTVIRTLILKGEHSWRSLSKIAHPYGCLQMITQAIMQKRDWREQKIRDKE